MSNNSQKAIALLVIIMTTGTPVLAFDNATINCFDNDTLLENITVYKDGNSSWLSVSTDCGNGCDNVTNNCRPLEYEEDFYFFIIAIAFFIGLAVILKYLRKR